MKKYLYGTLVGILILIGGSIVYKTTNNKNNISQSTAIAIVKTIYPEFIHYPNDNLPPQSIRTEKDTNGWYVAFVQEGSGRPILGAKCFFVNNDGSVYSIGEFNP